MERSLQQFRDSRALAASARKDDTRYEEETLTARYAACSGSTTRFSLGVLGCSVGFARSAGRAVSTGENLTHLPRIRAVKTALSLPWLGSPRRR
jgi:hypothetical protein